MNSQDIIVAIPHCQFVNGFKRGALYDVQRHKYYLVPNTLINFVKRNDRARLEKIFSKYNYDEHYILEEYLTFLQKIDAIYFAKSKEEAKMFSILDFTESTFCKISNAIVYNLSTNSACLINKLEKLNCLNLKIILRSYFHEKNFNNLMKLFDNTGFKHIELCFPFADNPNLKNIEMLLLKNQRCGKIIFYKAEQNKTFDFLNGHSTVELLIRDIFSVMECRCINRDDFIVNQELFCESQNHNTCLNRKLCIDKDGYIKNCPYMEQHYGHISNTNIEDVVNLPEFQKWWHIKKDDIDVCKDCEFRHMCTDCRAFIKDPENIYSQPAKCTYNPYICKWEGEEGYVPVEECGTYSRETGFVPDKKKIKRLNKQIWGDE